MYLTWYELKETTFTFVPGQNPDIIYASDLVDYIPDNNLKVPSIAVAVPTCIVVLWKEIAGDELSSCFPHLLFFFLGGVTAHDLD